MSAWWREFASLIGTDLCLSMAFHPQTDGQTEQTNQTVEHYLQTYTNCLQTNWSSLFDLAKFSYNHAHLSSTAQSPFHCSFGFDPRALIDNSVDNSFHPPVFSPIPDAQALVTQLENMHTLARSALVNAADCMKRSADSRLSTPLSLEVGNMVLIWADHICTSRPLKSLMTETTLPYPLPTNLGPTTTVSSLPYP